MASNPHYTIGTPNHDAPKTIVVMGTARGGTSMVAGTISLLGINLGERLGENHEDPAFLSKDLDEIRKIITERNNTLENWGWKMPHSLEYIDQIEDDIRNPHFIFVWRNTLATSMSQVTRKNANIHDAIAYSTGRLNEMVKQVRTLKSPMLLVDYDKAMIAKDQFINKVANFIGINVDHERREKCLDFIDPDKGYQQILNAFYNAEKVPVTDGLRPLHVVQVLNGLEITQGQNYLTATNPNPRIIFRTDTGTPLPKEFILQFENRMNKPSSVRFLFDFNWHFAQNLSITAEIEPGTHAFRVETNGEMVRFAVLPSITGRASNLTSVNLYQA